MTAEEIAALQNDALAALRSAIGFGRSGDAIAFLDLCVRLGALEPSRCSSPSCVREAHAPDTKHVSAPNLGDLVSDLKRDSARRAKEQAAKTDAWRKALDNHDAQSAPTIPVSALADFLRSERAKWEASMEKNHEAGLPEPYAANLGRARECEAIAQHFGISLNSTEPR